MNKENTNKLNLKHLLSPIKLGPFELKNKVMFAALTRMRADPQKRVVLDHHVKYYTERAEDAGIILTECMAVDQAGDGFIGALSAFNNEHLEGLKKLTKSIHEKKGVVFAQLYHSGRATSSKLTGVTPVSSSDILNRSNHRFEKPEALSIDGIKKTIESFTNSFKLCKEAGFDGVEIHGANGYLIDQFLRSNVNTRTDEYGGSIEKRCKFLLEILDSAISVLGSDRVGIKLTPCGRFNDMYDSDPVGLTNYLLKEINDRKILFVEFSRPPDFGISDKGFYENSGEEQVPEYVQFTGIKKLLSDVVLVGNGTIGFEEAEKFLENKTLDMVSFGRSYMSNPDLCERLKNGWEVDAPEMQYGFGEKGPEWGAFGYSEYPKYSDKVKKN